MNLFDLVAGGVLLVSAIVGFSRGAILEVVTLFAFTVAAALSVYLLPFTAPIARHNVHPAWAANAVSVILAFLVAYIALRVLGSSLSASLRRQSTLGTLDRGVGLAFGVVRALVILGVFYLVFSATPVGIAPDWVRSARLFPLSRASGRTIASVAPDGLKAMGGLGQVLKARADQSGDAGEDAAENVDASAAPPPPPPSDTPPEPPRHHLQVVTGEPPVRRLHHHHHLHPPEPVERPDDP